MTPNTLKVVVMVTTIPKFNVATLQMYIATVNRDTLLGGLIDDYAEQRYAQGFYAGAVCGIILTGTVCALIRF